MAVAPGDAVPLAERAGPPPGRHAAGGGDRPDPRRAQRPSPALGRQAPDQAVRVRRRGRRRAHPDARRVELPEPARLARAHLQRAPVHARRPPDDRRLRAHGPVLAPLRPRPDSGAADAGARPGDLRVGGADLERAGEPARVRADRRRSPGRLGPGPARGGGDAPRGARGQRGRLHRRRKDARPHRPGHDLPANPDQRLPALVPSSAPGAATSRSSRRPPKRSARSSSATVAGSRSGGSPSSPATTTRTARRRSAGRPGWCATSAGGLRAMSDAISLGAVLRLFGDRRHSNKAPGYRVERES